MLTRRPSLNPGAIHQTPQPGKKAPRSQFFGSRRIHPHSSDGDSRRLAIKKALIQAATESRFSRTSRASLAYVRSLSKGQRGIAYSTSGVNRPVAGAEKLHVISYSELILRRRLDGGLSLIEANECGDESVCWEEAWKLYVKQKQAANLRELSTRVEAASSHHQNCTGLAHELPSQPSLPAKRRGASLEAPPSPHVSRTVAANNKPPSSAPAFSSAAFLSRRMTLIAAGRKTSRAEENLTKELRLAGKPGATSDANCAGYLEYFSEDLHDVIFVPIMELCAGRQSVRNITRIAFLVALSGMGVLEEEGFGWKGISLPQVGDLWGLAASAVYALHIFRSGAHSGRFQPFQLTAIQCGTVASLSLLWEISRACTGNTSAMEYIVQLQSLPWGPLVYSGLVCAGLCSWLEIRGLRSVHASTATMVNTTIPIWGAFLSFFLRGEALDDSAIVGGSVILAASLFAQIVSKQDDTDTPKAKRMARLSTESTSADAKLSAQSGRILERGPFAKHVDHVPENSVTPNPKPAGLPAADHVQGAIITSQLKFPYYAAQAKRLLVEAKLKLLSVKSLVISATSSMLMTTPPGPPASTAITASASLQQAVNVVNNGASSSSSFQVPVGGAPATVAVLQWLDAAAAVLESAAMAVGSDIVQAVQAAEDVGTAVEQAVHKVVEHMAMVASSAEFSWGRT